MKILYVTGMGIPLRDILSGKATEEVTHLPGFFQPWYRLVQRGHQVDFVVTSNFSIAQKVSVDWFSSANLIANIYDPATEVSSLGRLPRQLSRLIRFTYHVNRALRQGDYDFVICWSFIEGFVGNLLANLHGVPCGMRIMGTLRVPELRKYGPVKTALRHPIEYLSFRLKKKYILMTDDGTNGDELYRSWRPVPDRYKFLFWKTGVTFKTVNEIATKFDKPSSKYIFFAARFDSWKRHDLIVETLKKIHARGEPVHLYFAGAVHSKSYFEEIMRTVRDAGLSSYVHYLGAIPGDRLRLYAYHAVANIFMYDVSNLGNVFFETYTTGGIIIGKKDGTLDEYIDSGRNGFLVEDTDGATEIVIELLSGNLSIDDIRSSAIRDSLERCFSMEERFDAEVALIERVVETGETGMLADKDGICRLEISCR
jgi:glycosyltransferase involved in cell wall biosynthesis